MRRGIGVEGVASQLGVLGGPTFSIDKTILIKSLCYRFEATELEARRALARAVEVGAVVVENSIVKLIRS